MSVSNKRCTRCHRKIGIKSISLLCNKCLNIERLTEENPNLSKQEILDKLKSSKSNKCSSIFLQEWECLFKEIYGEFVCQSCGKMLSFPSRGYGLASNTISFDHRNGDEVIKGSPSGWLSSHRLSVENIDIWFSCDFGMLCRDCNTLAGSPNNRKERLIENIRSITNLLLNYIK